MSYRLGETYQRWNETEGQREAKLHQQRKRLARQAKQQEEVSRFELSRPSYPVSKASAIPVAG